MLTPLHLIFYVFAAVAVLSAVCVVTAKHPVRSVLSLVVTFFASSGLWMILNAEFLSLILLLVYVGAVMTLFLFVVMMLSVEREAKSSGFIRYLPFTVLIVLLTMGLLMIGFHSTGVSFTQMPIEKSANYNNIAMLGHVLYTTYAYPFEIAGVILLAAIIAAITLTHRGPQHRKVQKVSEQLSVRPEDRVRLVKMPSSSDKGKST